MKRSISQVGDQQLPILAGIITGDYEQVGHMNVDITMYGINSKCSYNMLLYSIYLPEDVSVEIFKHSSKKDIWSHQLINKACHELIWNRVLRYTFKNVNFRDRIKITQLVRLSEFVRHLSFLNLGVWPFDDHMELIVPEIDPVYTITNTVLQQMTKLTYLNLAFNTRITDISVSLLTNLRQLVLTHSVITDTTLLNLPHLRHLDLWNNEVITDASVSQLTNLKSINLNYNYQITDAALCRLTNLTKLDMSGNDNISDYSVRFLTNLRSINVATPVSMILDIDLNVTSASLECLPLLSKITFRKLDIIQLFSHNFMKKFTMQQCDNDEYMIYER